MRIETPRAARHSPLTVSAPAAVAPAPRNPWKADVTFEGMTVRKDFSRRGPLARLAGRLMLNREQRALVRADGIPGVPRFLARPDRYALLITRVEGAPINTLKAGDVDESYIAKLAELFTALHARGVAHGDAHHRNILAYGNEPGLVDFATAWTTRAPGRNSQPFEWFCQLDRRQLFKAEFHLYRRGTRPEMFLLYRLFKN
jgi:hypothetical protein